MMLTKFRVKWGPSVLGLVFYGARNLTSHGKWETDPAKLPESLRSFLNLRTGHRVTFGDFDYGGQDARRSPEEFRDAVKAGEEAMSSEGGNCVPARASGGHLTFDCTVDVEPNERILPPGYAAEIQGAVEASLRASSSFKNGHEGSWVCEFGWKDADLEATGCTGIESIRAHGSAFLVKLDGHKTFCLVCEGNNDAKHPERVNWDDVEEISRDIACSSVGSCTDADSDSVSFSVSDEISVRVRKGESPATIAERIRRKAEQFVETKWEPEWVAASEELDRLWHDVKAGKYNTRRKARKGGA